MINYCKSSIKKVNKLLINLSISYKNIIKKNVILIYQLRNSNSYKLSLKNNMKQKKYKKII